MMLMVTLTQIESKNENDGVGAMEYNNQKPTKKKRRAKKEKVGKNGDESNVLPTNGKYEKDTNSNGNDDSYVQESSSQYFKENEDNGGGKENEQRKVGHFCETCEEEFESRNKLHKHLSDYGRMQQ
ncbi:DNAJ protein JJJ1 homolog [Medicago truncatula]|nr:DNAJ protein JJJ1 homolog [Medicago truncatula]AES71139.1 hypothetical protein MTR_3g070480 [Medicago truncatula]